MPSTRDDSSGTPLVSSPGSVPPVFDGLDVLIASTAAATDRWIAAIDWDDHDAAVAALVSQSQATAVALLRHQNDHAADTVPAAPRGPGDATA